MIVLLQTAEERESSWPRHVYPIHKHPLPLVAVGRTAKALLNAGKKEEQQPGYFKPWGSAPTAEQKRRRLREFAAQREAARVTAYADRARAALGIEAA